MAKTNKDYLELILEMMQDNFNRLEKKVDDNITETKAVHEQAKKTNGRVNTHDKQLEALEKITGRKFNWAAIDNKVLIIFGAVSLIVAITVASIFDADISEAFKWLR